METTLYCATCLDGKLYFGITARKLAARWREHMRGAGRGKYTKFFKALTLYGPEAFDFKALYVYPSRPEAVEAETYLIEILDTVKNGYNSKADHGCDPDTGRKISETKKGRPLTEAHKQALRIKHKSPGPLSEETKAKISAAKKGQPQSVAHKTTIAAIVKARDPSILAKISATVKALWATPEYRAKMAHRARRSW